MLVLSRRLGEKIVIRGLDLEIYIVAVQRSKVRIGISAPADVVVRRQKSAVATATVCQEGASSS